MLKSYIYSIKLVFESDVSVVLLAISWSPVWHMQLPASLTAKTKRPTDQLTNGPTDQQPEMGYFLTHFQFLSCIYGGLAFIGGAV